MIDVIKGSAINRLSLTTQFGTLSIPGALLEGIAFVTSDLFTISIIKCKLLTSRKTFRSKSVCMKNEVPKQLLSVVLGPSERLTWRSVLYVFNANQVSNNFFVSLPLLLLEAALFVGRIYGCSYSLNNLSMEKSI